MIEEDKSAQSQPGYDECSLASADAEPSALIFEPHNGHGHKDPNGDPWPFGYISRGDGATVPIFELNPFLVFPREELEGYARLFAAAPDLYEALKGMTALFRAQWEAYNPGQPSRPLEQAEAALARADSRQ